MIPDTDAAVEGFSSTYVDTGPDTGPGATYINYATKPFPDTERYYLIFGDTVC